MLNRKYTAYLLLLIATLSWAGNIIVGRYLHNDIPPFGLSFWRWLIALTILLVINGRHLVSFLKMFKANFYKLFMLSLFGVILCSSFQYVGLNYTSATDGGIILATMPIFITLCAEIMLKEKTSVFQKSGMLIAFIGALILITDGHLIKIFKLNFNFGDLILLMAAFMWGIYSTLLKKYKLPCSTLELVQATSLISVVLIAIILLAQGKAHVEASFVHLDKTTIAAFLYVGIFASVISYWGWNRGVEVLGPSGAGAFLYLTPLFSAVLARIFLNEDFHLYHLVGGIVIFLGVYLTMKKRPIGPL